MTRALEVTSHDTATSAGTASTRVDEGQALDSVFSYRELLRLDEALTMSSRETGLRFTLYIGDLGAQTRRRAEELFEHSGGHLTESVLLAVSPGQRVVEVVVGAAASRRLPDRACALAVLSMTNSFASGDLVGGIVNGLRQLSDQAGHPRNLRIH
ncbi:DUF5130 family protein [Geodermatophilus sabuli]|uniref:TLP18.3, Psb32 and MOLO-1 founding protein of phosphatase n=1 Tax=Geodermatophilus sabuli TaxID=1564158 RepID=A0A285E5T1_9ACTN|nr:DUF5130 family protein [Geodermatophilus sabuli]MBB3082666.1 hypothetical protein [Geodermatophilus sabuli]SNX94468.1 protein of unknown function [Geodermatophilus sabuli]